MKRYVSIFAVIALAIGAFMWNLQSIADARMQRPGLTQSEIKEKGKAGYEKGMKRWEDLSPEQQQHMSEIAKQRATQANQTGKEFWNSLSPEEQQKLMEGKGRVVDNAKGRWQKKPQ
uniref:DUF3106 domain-containing protein n=1 Tax=Desulfatirhabdium butyrativorans TaxID=340467 RepID=A0A7C4RQP3_9BACT